MISHCPVCVRPLAVHRSWSLCKLAPQVASGGLILYNGPVAHGPQRGHRACFRPAPVTSHGRYRAGSGGSGAAGGLTWMRVGEGNGQQS